MADIELVKEWFKYSNNDYLSAKKLFEDMWPKQLEISCYHCQQSAEKALKAYLIFRDIDPPWIHDLQRLSKLCADCDSSFAGIFDACSSITDFSVVSRYPNELDVDEVITKAAIEKAKLIYDFCFLKVFTVESIV
jgi:HEPN domain-containing protein